MSPSRTTLILWRHGQTDWNADSRFQGQADIPLNQTGADQARVSAQVLARLPIAAIYASPLGRARATAGALASELDLPIAFDDRLLEIDVGSWEGLRLADVLEANAEFAAAMAQGRDFRRSLEGETSVETGERMGAALREIAAAHPGGTVVVAAHGLAIRMATCDLLGWDYPTSIKLGGMHNCGWTTLETRNGVDWRLLGWNQVAN